MTNLFRQAKDLLNIKDAGGELTEDELQLINTAIIPLNINGIFSAKDTRMPQIGEIRPGNEIGYKTNTKCIWATCTGCGKKRWVRLVKGQPASLTCRPCSNRLNHPYYGKHKTGAGYIVVKIKPDDFFYPMANPRGYVKEHRLLMAKHVKRCLLPWEVVHHRNGIKDDNRLNNLQLLPGASKHQVDTQAQAYIKRLQNKLKIQQAQISQLQSRVKELDDALTRKNGVPGLGFDEDITIGEGLEQLAEMVEESQ